MKNLCLLMLAPLLCGPLFIAFPVYLKETPLNFYTFEDQILPNYYSIFVILSSGTYVNDVNVFAPFFRADISILGHFSIEPNNVIYDQCLNSELHCTVPISAPPSPCVSSLLLPTPTRFLDSKFLSPVLKCYFMAQVK